MKSNIKKAVLVSSLCLLSMVIDQPEEVPEQNERDIMAEKMDKQAEAVEPETEVASEEAVIYETVEETEAAVPADLKEKPLYTVNGVMLSEECQEYLYGQLEKYETEWFFPYALCELYQESRFNPNAVSYNGLDKGIAQFREIYFPEFAEASGLVEYDIFNVIDSLYVYAFTISKYLNETGSIELALSRYYLGEYGYSEQYVSDVLQWEGTLKEIKEVRYE